jgi:hypothetical protein
MGRRKTKRLIQSDLNPKISLAFTLGWQPNFASLFVCLFVRLISTKWGCLAKCCLCHWKVFDVHGVEVATFGAL